MATVGAAMNQSHPVYLCLDSVPLKRGGDFICYAFTAGAKYAQQRKEGQDVVFINDAGGLHLMPPKFMNKYFQLVEESA